VGIFASIRGVTPAPGLLARAAARRDDRQDARNQRRWAGLELLEMLFSLFPAINSRFALTHDLDQTAVDVVGGLPFLSGVFEILLHLAFELSVLVLLQEFDDLVEAFDNFVVGFEEFLPRGLELLWNRLVNRTSIVFRKFCKLPANSFSAFTSLAMTGSR
jgi:hypothetical protein